MTVLKLTLLVREVASFKNLTGIRINIFKQSIALKHDFIIFQLPKQLNNNKRKKCMSQLQRHYRDYRKISLHVNFNLQQKDCSTVVFQQTAAAADHYYSRLQLQQYATTAVQQISTSIILPPCCTAAQQNNGTLNLNLQYIYICKLRIRVPLFCCTAAQQNIGTLILNL